MSASASRGNGKGDLGERAERGSWNVKGKGKWMMRTFERILPL